MPRPKLPILDDVAPALVDEVIWGHRLRHSQTAWLLLLEMLNIAQACLEIDPANPLPDMGIAGAPAVKPKYRTRFRNLLFSLNQKAAELAAAVQCNRVSSDGAWDEWLKYAKDEYDAPDGADYSPLRHRFEDFIQFERAIDLVRSTSINGADGKKGVYSKFIFPMAPEALYWEMGVKGSAGDRTIDPTRNSFSRGGTLLHIMLARSASALPLRQELSAFLARDSQARSLIQQLQIEEPEKHHRDGAVTYLPYETHPRFDLLGEDFVKVLRLNAPENDKLLWLVTLGALHLSIYHAEIALVEYLNGEAPLDMICEIVAPKKTVIRQQSIDSLSCNSDLARRAIDSLLSEAFTDPDWQDILTDAECPLPERLDRACNFIVKKLRMPRKDIEEHKDEGDVAKLGDYATEYFRARHTTDFARVHVNYGREAGLVSKRATNRNRYAPTDQLLQSIVLANVKHETPMEEFLVIIYERYGIVVGPRQQAALIRAGKHGLAKDVTGAAFQRNEVRLEARLRSMGMLRRLSDSQAYVLNPLQPLE